MDRERRIEQHTWAGNSPETWRSCADDLLAAALVLRQRRHSTDPCAVPMHQPWRLHPIELMLSGLAVECLFKALWVKRGNRLTSERKYVGIPGAGDHDLVQLAVVVHFTLSDFEKDVLTRLSHFIEYGGRYPIPRNADKLTLTKSPHG